MKTILIIEAITMYGILIISGLLLLVTEIRNAIKKNKKEKERD